MTQFINKFQEIPSQCATMVDILRDRSFQMPHTQAFTFLEDGETQELTLTYQELDRRSRAVAAQLQALGLSGERAILLYPPGLDYLSAFFGCLYAGVVAIPAYPPSNQRKTPRIQAISIDAQASIALTTTAMLPTLQSILTLLTKQGNFHWLTTDNIAQGIEDSWQQPAINEDTLAFLQYTSGSTGTPKGVMLSHGNLLHNAAVTYQMMEHSPSSKFVSWLPIYHDMGLIGGILQPLYGGFPCVLMSPASFLQRPYRWLQAISRYKGTTSGGPNFAYEQCVQRITQEQKETLDLSSWSVAFNGAEPVRQDTLELFATTFAECGFRPEAFYPCYGMAEATLIVSGGIKTALAQVKTVEKSALSQNQIVEATIQNQDIQSFVSCGQTIPQQQIVIVNPETLTRCSSDEVGEIWVSGLSVGQGYWNRTEETEQTFHAYLKDTKERPFLRTGDLGFLDNGELFITGRAKDLIIIRGRNLYPQDIELTAQRSHSSLRCGANAAFTVEVNNEERLVVVQELEFRAKPNLAEVASAIRQSITEEHEVQVYGVVLIKPGSIPKTSSGKIQRRATRAQFENGELNVVESDILKISDIARKETQLQRSELLALSPRECQPILESYLIELLARVLSIAPDDINPQEPLSTLGLDSLKVFDLKNRIEVDLEVEVSVADFFEGMSTRSLVTKILAQLTAEAIPSLSLTQVQKAEVYPLSFAQQRLWFLDRLEPGNPAYNISLAINLKGQLEVTPLEQSLNEVIQRHETLRTTFSTVNGQSVQIIASSLKLSLSVIDYQNAAVQQLLTQQSQQPFDLIQGPLLRAKLLRLEQQEHVLLLEMHHIISDGWSVEVFLQEIALLYKAFLTRSSSPLLEVSIQYKDFAHWQRQWLQGEILQTQLSYWKQQLEGIPAALQLPTDRPRPVVQTSHGAQQSIELPEKVIEQLKAIARQEGVTLFMLLLAAFQTFLYRYTDQDDIAVGTAIANRNCDEIKQLIGFFVNTLVLRTDMSGNPTFDELLTRVKKVALGAYTHQDLPFDQIVEAVQPERHTSQTPLFQVMFNVQDYSHLPEMPGLALSLLKIETKTAQFDLSLSIEITKERVMASFEYNTDLFDAVTITKMLRHFQNLLSGIAVNPQARLSNFPLLSAADHHELLELSTNKSQIPNSQECIHQQFEAQVERTPNAVAVVFQNQYLTYRELNQRANQLAHYLKNFGVKPEVLVGICIERSLEMIIGLLGILKAGGAYLPLDPAYPKERLTLMLKDAQVSVLLTTSVQLDTLCEHQSQAICLDTDWQKIADNSQDNPINQTQPENLAYLIYTSGSTGTPKGVMIQHRSLSNYINTTYIEFALKSSDRLLQFTSISFDVAAEEIFSCLVQGATLILRTDQMLSSISEFLYQCNNLELTILDLPTSFWHQLTDDLSIGNLVLPATVRLVLIGGEKAEPSRLKIWRQQAKEQVRLINCYGPTETTISATMCDFSAVTDIKTVGCELPIGKPTNNIQSYVLDSSLQLVPIGVPGELYIGGVGVARGYRNRPELTAEKFIPNPYTTEPGARFYKTGDLVRYLPDGNLEFIGRIDHQVKIRGFRIELGEIEVLLNQHLAVRETVVVVSQDSVNSKRLVAYVVPQKGQTLTITELRGFLEPKLPSYMIPAAFVILEALPLTPNGKVDRKALPIPNTVRLELEETFVAPQTTIEKQLAVIWAEVLGLEKIGRNDNFFRLGGDSILSLQVIFKANQIGLNLTPKQLFQHQTIARLAVVAGTTKKIEAEQMAVTGALDLTPIQHWFFEQHQPEPHHWNQSVLLESKQKIDPVILEKIIEYLQNHHDVLRLRFIQEEFSTQALFASPDDGMPLTYFDFSALPKDKQAAAIEAAATKLQASLNLSQGPLFQVALFNLGENQANRLLWIIHHLVVDAVSWRILIEDFQTAYQQISQGKAIKLPPKTTSYKEWSSCLQKYAQSSVLLSEIEFWLTTQHQTISSIPIDFPGGNNIEETSSIVSVSLSTEETQSLLQQVPAAYRTQINDVLLTALIQTFHQWTGETSLLIDLEGHGREEIFENVDLSRTVGWFTSIFPVHLNLENTNDLGKALKSIKEQIRVIPNQGIGYGLLRFINKNKEINEQLSLSKAEVIFNYLGQFDQVLPESSLFSLVQGLSGSSHGLQNKRTHLLEINGGIYQGHLQMSWTYSKELYRQSTIEGLAQRFIEALRSLIAHCQSYDAGGVTPSDFAEFKQSQWDQADLDAITAAMGDM
ncbi:amino acid adenylation domain-containing protein [Nostoc commune NIES-4072]|uniref:Amino acid adenylation domain-containing protein n=1 Tax=Nostoc commune NIES-4072 TaxID=2005467 RepID=A0A2R5FJW3_NOSCO|nr:non-ribosomal peptide synthetase [Nostoc commune]BBD64374.1 amino acid adenylation domain-containing protein [Nostoc commune HK-02]GBG18299.1 amino acid adenylation domain-containing protein [Nostoc commune NIES-4072]